MARPLLAVDGDNLAHRAFHSTPKSFVGVGGLPINAITGFFNMLKRVCDEENPRGVFVAWDTLGVDTYRTKLWPDYQGGRFFEPAIVRQLELLPSLCQAVGCAVGKSAGFEADDLIASAVRAECSKGGACLIYTTDKDSYQLVSDTVTVISPQRGTRVLDRIGPTQVVERFGVLPEQVPDFKALAGDPSDKIPGAKGIGPKSAAAMLLKHGSLSEAVAGLAESEAERVLMFRSMVEMRSDLPVDLPDGPPDWAGGAEALRTIGANGLADRLSGVA